MRAWRFHETGDIRNLRLEEVREPVPGPGEALVRVQYAALNPADRYLVQGQYPRAGAPPFTPGRDGAGHVLRAAAGGRFKEGDAVCLLGGLTGISTPGTFADCAAIPEEWLAPVPDGWSLEEAAAGPLTLLTAWRALVVRGGLKAGETVLVTGASGGVGSAAVLLCGALGARVAALSRSAEKRAALTALGADIVVDAAADNVEAGVKEALGKERIGLVVENLGGPWLNRAARLAAPGGRVMVVGLLAGLDAELTVGLLIHKNLRVEGLSVSAYPPAEAAEAWREIVRLLGEKGKRPLVDSVFSPDQPQDAFAHLAEGPLGKVLVAFD